MLTYSQFSSSLRMRTIGASTVGSACICAIARFMSPSTVSWVRMMTSVCASPSADSRCSSASIEMPASARMPVMLRQHAGLVGHLQAQIEGGHDLVDRQDRRRRQRVGLERQVRHAVVRIGGVQPGDVDQVGDHRRRGRLGAGALAVVQRRADRIALHDDRVHRAFDVGDQRAWPAPASDARATRCRWRRRPGRARLVMPSSLMR